MTRTATRSGGTLTWGYQVAALAVEYLAAGETRVESFDVMVNDQQGGTATQKVAVTIPEPFNQNG